MIICMRSPSNEIWKLIIYIISIDFLNVKVFLKFKAIRRSFLHEEFSIVSNQGVSTLFTDLEYLTLVGKYLR